MKCQEASHNGILHIILCYRSITSKDIMKKPHMRNREIELGQETRIEQGLEHPLGKINIFTNSKIHTQTDKKIYITLFLVFVRLPIYCMYTYFLKEYFDILSFRIFLSPAVLLHPPTKVWITNVVKLEQRALTYYLLSRRLS